MSSFPFCFLMPEIPWKFVPVRILNNAPRERYVCVGFVTKDVRSMYSVLNKQEKNLYRRSIPGQLFCCGAARTKELYCVLLRQVLNS